MKIILSCGLTFVLLTLAGCGGGTETAEGEPEREVVVYAALDQGFSEPILKAFEAETGIRVRARYDVEAVKTVGLVESLIAEAPNPRCDVFWNNEIMHTIRLNKMGLLQPYHSPSAEGIPAAFKDSEGAWTGFAARARVIVYNTNLIPNPKDAPASIEAFRDPEYMGRSTIALPLFGTTATHVAVFFSEWGPDVARQWFLDLKQNKVLISPGNATVRDRVAVGELPFGWTDTDDAVGAMLDGKPVGMVFPDQEGEGTLLIPNTVCLMAGAPHPNAGKRLIDYLLSAEVEAQLAQARSRQIPLRPGVPAGSHVPALEDIVAMRVDWERAAAHADESRAFVEQEFGS